MAEGLIAQDLSMTIKDYDTGARVIVADTAAKARAALADVTSLVVAFIAHRPSEYAGSQLAQTISARGGRVVLLGAEAEATGPSDDWGVLYQPFSTECVLEQMPSR